MLGFLPIRVFVKGVLSDLVELLLRRFHGGVLRGLLGGFLFRRRGLAAATAQGFLCGLRGGVPLFQCLHEGVGVLELLLEFFSFGLVAALQCFHVVLGDVADARRSLLHGDGLAARLLQSPPRRRSGVVSEVVLLRAGLHDIDVVGNAREGGVVDGGFFLSVILRVHQRFLRGLHGGVVAPLGFGQGIHGAFGLVNELFCLFFCFGTDVRRRPGRRGAGRGAGRRSRAGGAAYNEVFVAIKVNTSLTGLVNVCGFPVCSAIGDSLPKQVQLVVYACAAVLDSYSSRRRSQGDGRAARARAKSTELRFVQCLHGGQSDGGRPNNAAIARYCDSVRVNQKEVAVTDLVETSHNFRQRPIWHLVHKYMAVGVDGQIGTGTEGEKLPINHGIFHGPDFIAGEIEGHKCHAFVVSVRNSAAEYINLANRDCAAVWHQSAGVDGCRVRAQHGKCGGRRQQFLFEFS